MSHAMNVENETKACVAVKQKGKANSGVDTIWKEDKWKMYGLLLAAYRLIQENCNQFFQPAHIRLILFT